MFDSCCNEEAVTWKEQKKILNPEMLDFLQLHCAVYSKKKQLRGCRHGFKRI